MELLDRFLDDDAPPPRTLLVVAHPDDETIGAGARLHRLREGWLVHLTDGAPRDGDDARAHGFSTPEAYAEARRAELAAVCRSAGIERTLCLGCPDQQAALALVALTLRLAELLERERVELVLTHPYEGGHPDHDATALVAHAAARRVSVPPVVAEMASYHRGADGGLETTFLPVPGAVERVLPLGAEQRSRKEALLALHRTQARTLAAFLPARVERFRVAPAPDFARPPHEGPLWYERFGWGVDGARFRALAAAATAELSG